MRPTSGPEKTCCVSSLLLILSCVLLHTTYPRVAASSPKGRHFSIIKGCFCWRMCTQLQQHRFMKRSCLQRQILMMLCNDLGRQYEIQNTATFYIIHFFFFTVPPKCDGGVLLADNQGGEAVHYARLHLSRSVCCI